jgi:hypothetical protein
MQILIMWRNVIPGMCGSSIRQVPILPTVFSFNWDFGDGLLLRKDRSTPINSGISW